MFQNMGLWDWVIIIVIVTLFFGKDRLPELARSLAKSISSFKKGMQDGQDELTRKDDNSDNPPKNPS